MIITVLDTETTGLDVKKHEIIQLGLIKANLLDYNEITILDKQQYNIRPVNIKTASPEALKINGYSEKLWENSIPFKNCFEVLNEIFSNSEFLIGQNLIFDLKFLNKEYRRHGLSYPQIPKYVDTKYMGETLVNEGRLKSSSMDNMCKHYNIKVNGRAHTALADCERTLMIWQKLNKTIQNKFFTYKEPYDAYKKINHARKIIR